MRVQGPHTRAVPVLALLVIEHPNPGRGPRQGHGSAAELHDEAGTLRRGQGPDHLPAQPRQDLQQPVRMMHLRPELLGGQADR